MNPVRRSWMGLLAAAAAVAAFAAGAALPVHAADAQPAAVTVFAAASLTDAVRDLAANFTRSTGIRVQGSYAASSALARQIESGAPADIFFSADLDWMDYLQQRDLIESASRHNLVGNQLVLIAPADSPLRLKIAPHFALRAALGQGRLATGDPQSVPVGRYAREALTKLGVWDTVADRLVPTDNVRAALSFVARGEAPLGIVYSTDAQLEPKVRIVAVFPDDTHAPIVYPAALTRTAKPGASEFLAYLQGPAGRAVFQKYGFQLLR